MRRSRGTLRFCRRRRYRLLTPAPPARRVPTHEEIAKLAYSYWESRGRQHGNAVEDWLRAERELTK